MRKTQLEGGTLDAEAAAGLQHAMISGNHLKPNLSSHPLHLGALSVHTTLETYWQRGPAFNAVQISFLEFYLHKQIVKYLGVIVYTQFPC